MIENLSPSSAPSLSLSLSFCLYVCISASLSPSPSFSHTLSHLLFCNLLLQGLVCLNCSSPSPLLRLARYLEAALCRAATSRLAVPFMRPLLPIFSALSNGTTNITTSTSSGGSSSSRKVGNSRSGAGCGISPPRDLLHLLEKVRQLFFFFVVYPSILQEIQFSFLFIVDQYGLSLTLFL